MERKINYNKHYSPLRYPGGKGCIFPFVSSIFYDNSIIGINYAEPYAGGSGLALRLLFEGYVSEIYINDFDKSIYSFWLSVLHRNKELCEWIKKINVSVRNWRKYKEIQNDLTADYFELAKSTFFLNRTNVSGVIKGGLIGGLTQQGKYKMDARFNKEDLINRIKNIEKLKHRIHISNLDGIAFIKNLNKKKEDIFIYLDPPYLQKGADLYMNYYVKKDHEKLAKHVKKMKNRWMVSYDNHKFILDLYNQNEKVIYKLSQCASNRIGDEILIFSQQIEYFKSTKSLQSPIILTA